MRRGTAMLVALVGVSLLPLTTAPSAFGASGTVTCAQLQAALSIAEA